MPFLLFPFPLSPLPPSNSSCPPLSNSIRAPQIIPNDLLVKICAGTTLLVALPAMVHQIVRPSPRGLLFCMANSAMAFYMFSFQVRLPSLSIFFLLLLLLNTPLPAANPTPSSLLLPLTAYPRPIFPPPLTLSQVHEKSILLPLLPITILAASEPVLALWMPLVACLSM